MERGVGLSVRSGWMMGKGQNLRSGYIFIYVKQAEFLLKSIYSTRLFFFTLTRIEIDFIESLGYFWPEKLFYACRVYIYDQKLQWFQSEGNEVPAKETNWSAFEQEPPIQYFRF